ncbi:MAG: hypothetical protein EOM69_03830 [Clostridia bacterium]|nr:hypothetical protein [Clostridia bacterium]
MKEQSTGVKKPPKGGETVTLAIKISDAAQFASTYDQSGRTLSDGLASFLDRSVAAVPARAALTLQFFCPAALSGTRRDAMQNMLRLHYGQRRRALGRALAAELVFLFALLAAGVALVWASSCAALHGGACAMLQTAGIVLPCVAVTCLAPRIVSRLRPWRDATRLLAARVVFQIS